MTTPLAASLASGGAAPLAGTATAQAGYGASLNDVASFEQALERARGAAAAGMPGTAVTVTPSQGLAPPGQAMQAIFRPLEHINGEASTLSSLAAAADGRAMTPGEMVQLTVKCHEFMFHCQLTANVANRTSDGLQQLFRQQA